MTWRLNRKLVLVGKSAKTVVSDESRPWFFWRGLGDIKFSRKASQVKDSWNRTKNQHWWIGRVDQGEREKEA